MPPIKSVSIIGCGWLGFPLAKQLHEKGINILATTTRTSKVKDLENAGFEVEILDLMVDTHLSPKLFLADVLVLAFPPKTKSNKSDWYSVAMVRLVDEVKKSKVKSVILLSSTSVYPDLEQVFSEDHPIYKGNTGNEPIYKAEQAILNCKSSKTYVLRLGGLAGDDRVLARHFAGKMNIKGGNYPVNLLHRVDAVQVIAAFVQTEFPIGIYNVCAPEHPTKSELYTSDCLKMGFELPHFLEDGVGKQISSTKLQKLTGYTFMYPNPLEFDYEG